MKTKQIVAIVLGVAAAIAAVLYPFEGLGLAGRLTLGIFSLAAIFWILEPIPIYATSMIVIFLQTMLLSQQGIVFSPNYAPSVRAIAESGEAFRVPELALKDDKSLYLKVGGKSKEVAVQSVISKSGGFAVVAAKGLSAESKVIIDAGHRSVATKNESYSKFYSALANPIIILFLGGFALATTAVKFKLDRNITRVLLKPFGTRPSMVCLGLMICAGGLSAFMSNTATTAMMMTVALPIIASLGVNDPFKKAIALCIPLAANIGGIATPIGTPPNAVALAAMAERGLRVSFSDWMLMAGPFAILLLFVSWQILVRMFKPEADRLKLQLDGEFDRSPKAIAAYCVFAGTILLWVTESLHGISANMVAFIPLAAMPALGVIDKMDIRGFSWETLWLVAGGISLGLSMEGTGMATWMIGLADFSALGPLGVIAGFGIVGFLLSNVISNTVAATMILPLAMSVGLQLVGRPDVEFALIPGLVAVTAIVSCSMILPISTPPNAIAMSLGVFEVKDMAKAGAVVGFIGCGLAVLAGLYVWPLVMG